MKTGIFTFRKYHGMTGAGSSTIRCKWLLDYWKEAEEFKYGKQYDAIIYQKVYYPKHAKMFKGVKILDLCDPDWMHWGYQIRAMIEEVDAITCSSQALTDSVKKFTKKPVIFIPDRVDLKLFKGREEHKGEAKTVAWIGYSNNYCVLDPAISSLIKKGLKLVVVSDKNYMPPAGCSKLECNSIGFTWDTLEDDLKGFDVDMILNPKGETGKWKYKSDNKSYISWAMGYPVAYKSEDIDRFIDAKNRNEEVAIRTKELKEKYDSKLSVNDFKALIAKISDQKRETKDV